MFDNIIFRQLFDAGSSTCTYVVGDPQSLHAVIIDKSSSSTSAIARWWRNSG